LIDRDILPEERIRGKKYSCIIPVCFSMESRKRHEIVPCVPCVNLCAPCG